MDDTAGVTDEYRRTSPWPIFVAAGLAVSEVGVVLGVIPLAVGGLLLFVGSIAGIVREAGYVAAPWRLLGGLGLVLVALGAILVLWQAPGYTVAAVVDTVAGALDDTPDGIVVRGASITAAGGIAVLIAAVGGLFGTDRDLPPA